jgi:hypothetical protein
MTWIAYCTDCQKTLDFANNGTMMQAIGELHAKETDHVVICGFPVKTKREQKESRE